MHLSAARVEFYITNEDEIGAYPSSEVQGKLYKLKA